MKLENVWSIRKHPVNAVSVPATVRFGVSFSTTKKAELIVLPFHFAYYGDSALHFTWSYPDIVHTSQSKLGQSLMAITPIRSSFPIH